jgi:hypothetical protein
MKKLTSFAFVAAAAIVVSAVAGCSASRSIVNRVTSTEGGKLYAVGVEKAAFYRYGPQQGNGPDQELPRDTLVRLVRNSFGYSKVVVEPSGQEGYVASEDLTVASASLIAAATATPPPQAFTSSGPAENLDVQSFDPGTMPPPEGLPAPDLPPASPEATPSPL